MHIPHVRLTGTHDRVALADLRRAINQAKGLGELLPLTVMLLQETEAMMNGRGLNENDIRRIAAPPRKDPFFADNDRAPWMQPGRQLTGGRSRQRPDRTLPGY